MKVKSESEVAQSCPTLSDPMDCSPPGSSVHGIFQARVLEGGAIAFSGRCGTYMQWNSTQPTAACGLRVIGLWRIQPWSSGEPGGLVWVTCGLKCHQHQTSKSSAHTVITFFQKCLWLPSEEAPLVGTAATLGRSCDACTPSGQGCRCCERGKPPQRGRAASMWIPGESFFYLNVSTIKSRDIIILKNIHYSCKIQISPSILHFLLEPLWWTGKAISLTLRVMTTLVTGQFPSIAPCAAPLLPHWRQLPGAATKKATLSRVFSRALSPSDFSILGLSMTIYIQIMMISFCHCG